MNFVICTVTSALKLQFWLRQHWNMWMYFSEHVSMSLSSENGGLGWEQLWLLWRTRKGSLEKGMSIRWPVCCENREERQSFPILQTFWQLKVGINNLQHMAWGMKVSELYNWEFPGWNAAAVEGSSEKNIFYHPLWMDKMDNITENWGKKIMSPLKNSNMFWLQVWMLLRVFGLYMEIFLTRIGFHYIGFCQYVIITCYVKWTWYSKIILFASILMQN